MKIHSLLLFFIICYYVSSDQNTTALEVVTKEDSHHRVKRQCNNSCSCSSMGCNGCSAGCGPPYSAQCRAACNMNLGGRLCCDDAQPNPCVNCGLASGNYPIPVPMPLNNQFNGFGRQRGCCSCCMPACRRQCTNFGGCRCRRFNRLDYYDYYG